MGLKGDTWSLALHQPDNKDRHKFAPSFSTLPSRLVNSIKRSFLTYEVIRPTDRPSNVPTVA